VKAFPSLARILHPLERRRGHPSPLPRPADRFGQLRFADGKLLDCRGKDVFLRGVSLFWSQWKPEFFNAGTVAWLAGDWRIDLIRAPIAVASPGYLSDPALETEKARTIIEAALDAGIYVLIDWHGHDPHTQQAKAFFETISAAYGDCPNILYEIWNEPAPHYRWEEDICGHHREVLHVIRSHAPRAPVVLGTPDYCSGVDIAAQAPLNADNVGYALHFYASTHRLGLRQRVDAALHRGIGIFASEWGVGECGGGGVPDQAEALRWLSFLAERRISHVNWSICDKAETCAALRPGASPLGGWPKRQLSSSGRFVRDYLRSRRSD
jgi:endoglucanase